MSKPLKPNAGGLGSIPNLGTRSYMPHLRVCMVQLKIPLAAVRLCAAKYFFKRKINKGFGPQPAHGKIGIDDKIMVVGFLVMLVVKDPPASQET